MTKAELSKIRQSYLTQVDNPDGTKRTLGAYIRLCLDGGLQLVTTLDMIVFDDTNETVHAVCVNEDGKSQANYPVKIISANYDMIQQVETVMSKADFAQFLSEGFIKDVASEAQIAYMEEWAGTVRIHAQQPMEAEPYFNTNPTIISKESTRIPRDDELSEEEPDPEEPEIEDPEEEEEPEEDNPGGGGGSDHPHFPEEDGKDY